MTKNRIKREYLAGLFDGEGSVGVYYHSKTEKMGATLHASIGQTASPIVEKLFGDLKNVFGGRIESQWTTSSKLHLKYMLTGEEAYIFLGFIKDVTLFKRQQIEIAMEWYDSVPVKNHGGKYNRLTDIEREASDIVIKTLKTLKREGTYLT